MGKKATKKSKAKNKEMKKPLKLKKSTIITIIAALALLVIISGIFIIRAAVQKNINDRTVRIAFYGLSDNLCTLIQEQAPQLDEVIFSFDKIAEDDADIDILNKKYDIAVRSGLHCAPLMHNFLGTLEKGAVRISIGYNNTDADAEKLIEAVRDIAEYGVR